MEKHSWTNSQKRWSHSRRS